MTASDALFGTDGVRGLAGQGALAPESVERLGIALGEWLEAHGDAGKPALLGGDTRASRGEITRALAAGLSRRSIRSIDLGVLPTAALALLIDDYDASCAAVISASHNPAEDNGIKIFTGHGQKFGDAEARFVEQRWRAAPPPAAAVRDLREEHPEGGERYLARLIAAAGRPDLRGMVVALDLAHGAAHAVGPELFRRLGATVHVIGDRPDGHNINAGCGSLHPEGAAALVARSGARFGLAVDGDADRSILVDEHGKVVDGDGILALVAADLHAQGRLVGGGVVGTVMSNFGLELFLKRLHLELVRTPVGDRHVSAALRERGMGLGGEPSGHVIFGADLDYLGDGLYTAVRVAAILARRQIGLSAALSGFERAPQANTQVRVLKRPPLDSVPGFKEILSASEERLGNQGRVVIRYSGTEPVCRVMVEGADATLVRTLTDELAGFLRKAIGAP
ncbi:MAG: phosphoglucosamine mutase [Planctomycetes bacterium]|nr:phosphoglucosamine mutase [Planctomycetota bacterium]